MPRSGVPSAAAVDAQSVKPSSNLVEASQHVDAGKKIKGRKRHLITDTTGPHRPWHRRVGTWLRRRQRELTEPTRVHPNATKVVRPTAATGPVLSSMARASGSLWRWWTDRG